MLSSGGAGKTDKCQRLLRQFVASREGKEALLAAGHKDVCSYTHLNFSALSQAEIARRGVNLDTRPIQGSNPEQQGKIVSMWRSKPCRAGDEGHRLACTARFFVSEWKPSAGAWLYILMCNLRTCGTFERVALLRNVPSGRPFVFLMHCLCT